MSSAAREKVPVVVVVIVGFGVLSAVEKGKVEFSRRCFYGGDEVRRKGGRITRTAGDGRNVECSQDGMEGLLLLVGSVGCGVIFAGDGNQTSRSRWMAFSANSMKYNRALQSNWQSYSVFESLLAGGLKAFNFQMSYPPGVKMLWARLDQLSAIRVDRSGRGSMGRFTAAEGADRREYSVRTGHRGNPTACTYIL